MTLTREMQRKRVSSSCSTKRLWLRSSVSIGALVAHLALATHDIFLETDMRVAWMGLLEKGRGYEGAGELLDGTLAECHSRANNKWGEECDHAFYLQTVLQQASRAAETTSSPQVLEDPSIARPQIPVESQESLPFSAFFARYAVPRHPVIITGESRSAIGVNNQQEDGILAQQGFSDRDEADGSDQKTRNVTGTEQSPDRDGALHLSPSDSPDSPLTTRAISQSGGTTLDSHAFELLTACVSHESEEVKMAAEPLRFCGNELLSSWTLPAHVSADYVQRYRLRDVLPEDEHAEVERFVAG